VKLWPTLVLLRDGVEVSRVVRPGSREAVDEALAALDA
jgi:thioredoxin 1